MVGMPRISCFLRGAEPCIIMLIMFTMLILLTIIVIVLMIMLIMYTIVIASRVPPTLFRMFSVSLELLGLYLPGSPSLAP